MSDKGKGKLPEIPELTPEYQLVRELGRGGTAVVYLARDVELGRDVAIKLIRPTYVEDEDAVARLVREAQTVGKLQHPNIVMLLGTRRIADGGLALILQYVPGQTLKDRIREAGPLPYDEVRHVLRNLGAALAFAHRARIVHRDIKPENVYLDESVGLARLADFGIARAWDSDSGLTLPGTALGTPSYMSPEQVDGQELDGRSDIYSLGVLGWEMLSGRQPWEGESLYTVIFKQKNEELPRIRTFRPDVPENLLRALEGAMRKRPGERWRTAEAFLRALDARPVQSGRDAGAFGFEPSVAAPKNPAEGKDGTPSTSEPPDATVADATPSSPGSAAPSKEDGPDEIRLPPLLKPPPWTLKAAAAKARGGSDGAPAVAQGSLPPAAARPVEDTDRVWTLPGGVRVSPGVVMIAIGGLLSLVLLGIGAAVLIPSSAGEESDAPVPGVWSTAPSAATVSASGDPEPAPALDRDPDSAAASERRLAVLGGDAQSAAPGAPLAEPLLLRVVDGHGRAVSGVTVRFDVTAGGGSVEPATAVSRADGTVVANWTLGEAGAQRVRARVSGGGDPEVLVTAVIPPPGGDDLAASRTPDPGNS